MQKVEVVANISRQVEKEEAAFLSRIREIANEIYEDEDEDVLHRQEMQYIIQRIGDGCTLAEFVREYSHHISLLQTVRQVGPVERDVDMVDYLEVVNLLLEQAVISHQHNLCISAAVQQAFIFYEGLWGKGRAHLLKWEHLGDGIYHLTFELR